MKSNLFILLGLLIAGGLLTASALLPGIQTKRLAHNREITTHLETARRLVKQYLAALSDDNSRRELIRQFDPQVELPLLATADVDALLNDPDVDVADRTASDLGQYNQLPGVSQIPQAERELLELRYGQEGATRQPTYRPATRLTSASMVRQGSQEYEGRLSANSKWLDQAEAEIKLALSIEPQHAVAHRLMGMIQYQRGLTAARKVSLMRRELNTQRAALVSSFGRIQRSSMDHQLIEHSDIEARIAGAQQDARRSADAVSTQQQTVQQLAEDVETMRAQVDEARSRSEAAREAMEALQELGVDLNSNTGFEDFRKAYEEQANNYRIAIMQMHIHKYGTLTNAAIDYTGDYVHGKYEPILPEQGIQFDRGLVHYEQDLASAETRLQKLQASQERLQENVQVLENLKDNLQQRQDHALGVTRDLTGQLEASFEQFREFSETVRQAEESAVQHFESASKSFTLAANGISSEESRARQNQPSDPQRQPFDYTAMASRQEWLKGQLYAQQADCELRLAILTLGRYQNATSNLRDLAAMRQLFSFTEDQDAWAQDAEEQKAKTLYHAELARTLLQDRAKNAIGKGNWIIAGEIGTAYFLQALLNEAFAAEKALEWYKIAVQDREDKPFAMEHVAMRDYIASQIQDRDH